jgi:hypothetical protein
MDTARCLDIRDVQPSMRFGPLTKCNGEHEDLCDRDHRFIKKTAIMGTNWIYASAVVSIVPTLRADICSMILGKLSRQFETTTFPTTTFHRHIQKMRELCRTTRKKHHRLSGCQDGEKVSAIVVHNLLDRDWRNIDSPRRYIRRFSCRFPAF